MGQDLSPPAVGIGQRDEQRRHHAVNAGVFPDCRQIGFCAERSGAGRGQNAGKADADIRAHAQPGSLMGNQLFTGQIPITPDPIPFIKNNNCNQATCSWPRRINGLH